MPLYDCLLILLTVDLDFDWYQSVALNDLEWRNGCVFCIILPNLLAFGPYYVKVDEDTPIHSASEM